MPRNPVPSRQSRPFRTVVFNTVSGLRMDRGTAILIGVAAAAALAALLPVASLMGAVTTGGQPRLEISTIGGGLLGLPWADPTTPAGIQLPWWS